MTARPSWPVAVAGGIVLAAAILLLGVVLLRPTTTASIGAGITVECDGIGSTEACADWAATILADGPGIRTFDPDDLVGMRLIRPFLVPGECEVEYFIGRMPDEPAASEAIGCPD